MCVCLNSHTGKHCETKVESHEKIRSSRRA
jgi:hypothetical protein